MTSHLIAARQPRMRAHNIQHTQHQKTIASLCHRNIHLPPRWAHETRYLPAAVNPRNTMSRQYYPETCCSGWWGRSSKSLVTQPSYAVRNVGLLLLHFTGARAESPNDGSEYDASHRRLSRPISYILRAAKAETSSRSMCEMAKQGFQPSARPGRISQ